MGVLFNTPSQAISTEDMPKAIQQLENMVRAMQEQLEYTLYNLDSSNITEINTNVTNVTNSDGNINLSGDELNLAGRSNERFRVGLDKTSGLFRFELTDKNGNKIMYLSSDNSLVITKTAHLSLDEGVW